MLNLIALIFFYGGSNYYSDIISFSQIANLTLSFKKIISYPYTISPLIITPHTLINSHLTITHSRFFKIPLPIIQGFSKPLKIYKSKFTFCNTPIHLTSSTQSSLFNRYNYTNDIVTIENTDYRHCFSITSNGGCIYLSNTKITITKCNFLQSTALSGGAIYSINGKLRIHESNFIKNSATEKGGALFLNNTIIAMNKCQIALNKAGEECGAIYSKRCNYENFIQNNLNGNFAYKKYGGLFLDECFGVVISCFFKNNKANESNIGSSLVIFDNSDQINIENSFFYDKSPYQIMISASSVSIVCDCLMAASEENAIYILNRSSDTKFLIVNNFYNYQKMPEHPNVPLSLLYDIFIYNEKSPPIKWNLIIIISSVIFIIFCALIEWILPIIIWPNLKEKKGYTRQSNF